MTDLYDAAFSSTDDAEIDSITTVLEDKPMRFDEIIAICERYQIAANISQHGILLRKYVPESIPQRSWRV